MPCYTPLKAININETGQGKKQLKFGYTYAERKR